MELVILRLIQECLTNVHRRSGGNTASIRVVRSPEAVTVQVEDQGKGMTPERLAEVRSRSTGVGIRAKRERVRLFNGEIQIDSNTTGTTISVTIPNKAAPLPPKRRSKTWGNMVQCGS